MSLFTGSELIGLLVFEAIATPSGGGAIFSTNTLRSAGIAITASPIDQGGYIEIPTTLEYPAANSEQANFLSLHFNPSQKQAPFLAQFATNVGNGSNIAIFYNPAEFPLGQVGILEVHYAIFRFPHGTSP